MKPVARLAEQPRWNQMALGQASRNQTLREWSGEHPEWWSLALSAAAWLWLLSPSSAGHASVLCVADSSDLASQLRLFWQGAGAVAVVCVAMAVAMVPPLAAPMIRHVAVRSFAVRRIRAIGLFLTGAIGIWVVAGLTAIPVLTVARSMSPVTMPAGLIAACGFAVAALWQVSPAKRRTLVRCHRTAALAPFGWRADRDCLTFGAEHGSVCVTNCWALMLAATLAGHGPLVCLGVQAIALAERRARRPDPALSASVLLACAALALLGVVIFPG